MEQGVHCNALIHDITNRISYRENIEGIDEWPHKWPDGDVSYRLNNFSEDFKDKWQITAVTVALRWWQLYIQKLNFRREYNATAHVDFNVEWMPLAHFDNRKGILAHAYFPGQGDISGDVHINDDWSYVSGVHLQDLAHPPLTVVMAHEFGHSLGLRHDTMIEAMGTEIMYPSLNLGEKVTQLGPRSIARIQDSYGARTVSQRILDYFAGRRLSGKDFR